MEAARTSFTVLDGSLEPSNVAISAAQSSVLRVNFHIRLSLTSHYAPQPPFTFGLEPDAVSLPGVITIPRNQTRGSMTARALMPIEGLQIEVKAGD